MCSEPFEFLARATSKSKGLAKMPLIVVPWPVDPSQAPEVARKIIGNLEPSARRAAPAVTR